MQQPGRPADADTPGRSALALLLLVPAPTIGVTCAMHLFPDTALGKSVQLAMKVWLLALPLLWLVFVQKRRPRIPKWSSRGMVAGVVTGLLTMAFIIGAWELVGRSWVDVELFRDKMHEIGLGSIGAFLLFAAAISFINALLEEYVWRWFVYSKWRDLLNGPAKSIAVPGAIVLAGLCFVIHHTVAMSLYFGWQANALASLGIFIGGVTWSIIYIRYKNIWPAYVSHILADLAVFYVGYTIAFG